MITTSNTIVKVIEAEDDVMVEGLFTIGSDGIENIQRSLFVNDEYQETTNNPESLPDDVKQEVRRQVSLVAQAKGDINKL